MIGVLARDDQRGAIEEFFQLFKTPWQPYVEGRHYDVVISSLDALPAGAPRLVVICGAEAKRIDRDLQVAGEQQDGGTVRNDAWAFPVYGRLATFRPTGEQHALLTTDLPDSAVAVRLGRADWRFVIRLGYDLFDEVAALLRAGQPIEHAAVPTLDLHIAQLREWMVKAEVPFVEISAAPAGTGFAVCLTHDIDFVGIRRHFFDHSLAGFVYRATVGATRNFLRGRLTLARLWQSWLAVASLPLVFFGWLRDFWEPFDWYLAAEKGLPATYFLIPFKRRAGMHVPGNDARRATAYDVADISDSIQKLLADGSEVGVHGIDAWHDEARGREERARVAAVAGSRTARGIRMHWLLQDASTPASLESAGYEYDSTSGYNETVGFRNGTGQVFRPLSATSLLELPMHIQDGALFYGTRLDLSEEEAHTRCLNIIRHAENAGGVVTVLWHDRSHGPERFWGGFYLRLIASLKERQTWFDTASAIVSWFRARRDVRFVEDQDGRVSIEADTRPQRAFCVRIHRMACISHAPLTTDDCSLAWTGESALTFEPASSVAPMTFAS
jgi:hypothetical protein